MKNTVPLLLLLGSMSCGEKEAVLTDPATKERYKDELFSSFTKSTVQFDTQPDYHGKPTALSADLYQPTGDKATNRAVVVYVHGGGFIGGTRDGSNIPYLCEELSKRGYVVASIDYRVGVVDASPMAKGKAQIRAIQDLKSFVRYAKFNAASARIDVNKIFITGSSAGGATVLATAYLAYSERPTYMDTTGVGSLEGRGNLNGSNAAVKAVYSLWGAVSDTTWIQRGDVPVGCIQSVDDPCIPWNYGPSSCNVPGYGSYGSHAISTKAKNSGIYSSLHGYSSSEHDYGFTFPHIDTTIAKMTDFLYPLAK
ncbi:MAG: alpha/beta hydrolase [Ferruginibacter sp.]|nr:alpha/beta hydrolase [Cytophagales bacterium]